MKARWIVTAVCVGLAAMVAADNADAKGGQKLVGTWRVTYLEPDGRETNWIVVHHKDNTTTGISPFRQDTSFAGLWEKISGDDYSNTIEWLHGRDEDGMADTRFRGRNTVHLDGDTISGTTTLDVLSLDGTMVVAEPFPGITFVGTRMFVIPEE